MRIEYDPKLTEAVVMQEISKKERDGDLSLQEEYHSIGDTFYDLPAEEREEEFEKLHNSLFLKLGYEEVIKDALKEFSSLEEKVGYVNISKSDFGEEANLMRKGLDDVGAIHELPLHRIRIKIRPEMFLEVPQLRKVLRHELMHIMDIMDDTYGYETKIDAANPTEEIFIRDRYRVIWDIYIDSRLTKGGKETVIDKDKRFLEFSSLYQKIPYSQRVAVFEGLWATERMTHREILDMARDPVKLVEKAEMVSGKELMEKKKKIHLPGALCPMCKFPTFHWIEELNPEDERDKKTIAAIKEDFPGWEPEEGACERCVEIYRMRAGVWGQARQVNR